YSTANELPNGLVTVENTLCYVDGTTPSVAAGAVCVSGASQAASISVEGTVTAFAAARLSSTGTCFAIYDTGVTHFGPSVAATCTADWAITPGNVTATTVAAGGW